MTASLGDKIIIIEDWKREAELVANSRFDPGEDASQRARELAGMKRDIAAVKATTLDLVLTLLKAR